MKLTTSVHFLNLLLLSFLQCLLAQSTPTSAPPLPPEALPTKAGYLPVNAAGNSAIFYAFYEAQFPTSPLPDTPLLIWLQGGPGCSSMIGNFIELGPWRIVSHGQNNQHLTVERNFGAWNRKFGLLFLDNPIGTGFSIAAKPEEIPRNQKDVAKHLYLVIKAFIKLDPSFKNRPVYITGESYAGKYVPAVGNHIFMANQQQPLSRRVKLAGVAIGNGLTDPINQVATHADNAHFSGFINERQKAELEKAQWEAVKLIKMEKWSEATDARHEVLHLLRNMTGLATLSDYTRKTEYPASLVSKFLEIQEVKRALGLNESAVFDRCSRTVKAVLHADVMKSVRYMVELLVKKCKVLLYQGHNDLRDGVVSTEAWVKTLDWEGLRKFLSADRQIWKVNGELAGYVQKWGRLSHVIVLGAGHLVPADQAQNSQAMIEDWVLDRGLFSPKHEN